MKEQRLEEEERVSLLPLGGDDQGKIDAKRLSSLLRTIAETDFAKDDGKSEALLSMVVGGGHSVDLQEGQDTSGIPLGVDQPLPQILGFGMKQGPATDGFEPALKRRDSALRP